MMSRVSGWSSVRCSGRFPSTSWTGFRGRPLAGTHNRRDRGERHGASSLRTEKKWERYSNTV